MPAFARLGRWSPTSDAPVQALLVHRGIALGLFFLLVGVSLIVLRVRDPPAPRPFRELS